MIRTIGGVLVMMTVMSSAVYSEEKPLTADKPGKKINMQVSSADLENSPLDRKLNPPEQKPVFFKSGNASLTTNEDNEPNINMNF
jgi:hypothetical protein